MTDVGTWSHITIILYRHRDNSNVIIIKSENNNAPLKHTACIFVLRRLNTIYSYYCRHNEKKKVCSFSFCTQV